MHGTGAPSLQAAGVYVNHLSPPSVLSPRQMPSGSNSLQGALSIKAVSSALPLDQLQQNLSQTTAALNNDLTALQPAADGPAKMLVTELDKEMQRQLEDYNRSVTLVIWYKAHRDPLRIQHTNTTFPYFQLAQIPAVVKDLGLGHSYIDTYDLQSCTWEQHTIESVRIVSKQQRLLYRIRKSLLEGLDESECPGMSEEVLKQAGVKLEAPMKFEPRIPLKRPLPDSSPVGPPAKVHVTDFYNADHTSSVSPTTSLSHTPLALQQTLPPPAMVSSPPTVASLSLATASPSMPSQRYYPPPPPPNPPAPAHTQPTPTPTSSSTTPAPSRSKASPALNSASASIVTPTNTTPAPIPYHPHPPLKRWPNDYSVSEISTGFDAMDSLVRTPPPGSGSSMTQKLAFERVFGSRYVKSTVCRHRGLWRKADALLREEFEKMGTDEKACWGEFVKRVEGRGGKSQGSASANPGDMFEPSTPALVAIAPQVRSSSGREDRSKALNNEPVMASL